MSEVQSAESDALDALDRLHNQALLTAGDDAGRDRANSDYLTILRAFGLHLAFGARSVPPAECASPECDHGRTIPGPGCTRKRKIPPSAGGPDE
ncbi:hypothetical protein [Nocardioides pakistanensis]